MKFAVDSSFFIGLFTADQKAKLSKKLFFSLKEKREKVYVPLQAMSEVVEILENRFNLDRDVIYDYMIAILSNYVFYVEKGDLFYRVIELYKKHPSVNIKKLLIMEESRERQISKILSLDSCFDDLDMTIIKKI